MSLLPNFQIGLVDGGRPAGQKCRTIMRLGSKVRFLTSPDRFFQRPTASPVKAATYLERRPKTRQQTAKE